MTNTQRDAMQQAFEALREIAWSNDSKWQSDRAQSITEPLRAALAEPVVEPVAWKHDCAALLTNDVELWIDHCPHCGKPQTKLTESPPPPADVPILTDEEAYAIYAQVMQSLFTSIKAKHYWEAAPGLARQFAREIEQAVRQKAGLV